MTCGLFSVKDAINLLHCLVREATIHNLKNFQPFESSRKSCSFARKQLDHFTTFARVKQNDLHLHVHILS